MNEPRPAATPAAITKLKEFISPSQLCFIAGLASGEEGQFYQDKLVELAALIQAMPGTYGQDGKGDAAVAYLHYFKGGCDWFITEKDSGTWEEPGQHQAYGLCDIGHGGELGYVSLIELLAAGIELDLHFTPTPLGQIKTARAAA